MFLLLFLFCFLAPLSRDFLILLPRFFHGETSNENHRLPSALQSIGRGEGKKKESADWYQEFIEESLSIGYLQGKNATPIEAVSVLSKQKLLIKRNKDSKASRIFIIIKRYAVRIFPIVIFFFLPLLSHPLYEIYTSENTWKIYSGRDCWLVYWLE